MLDIEFNKTDSKFVTNLKNKLKERFRPTQSKMIELANEVSAYIFASGDSLQAEKLLDSYNEQIPFEECRYQLWEVTYYSLILSAYIKQQDGREVEAFKLLEIAKSVPIKPMQGSSFNLSFGVRSRASIKGR